jgi:hypothetical protein
MAGAFIGVLLVRTPLHPPLAVVDAMNVAYAASTCACVWQAGTVTSVPQLNITAGASGTAKVAEQVFSVSQSLVTVHVTIVNPPHAGGAPALLLVNMVLHPPVKVVVASQLS